MGCCYSDEKENLSQGDENERTALLRNNVNNPSDLDERNYNSVSGGADEQTRINQIIHQTANDVIDVSSMQTPYFEQSELVDRENQYKQKLNQASNIALPNKLDYPSVDDPIEVLSSLPNHADITLLKKIALAANSAVSEIKIEHREPLVVQFAT